MLASLAKVRSLCYLMFNKNSFAFISTREIRNGYYVCDR